MERFRKTCFVFVPTFKNVLIPEQELFLHVIPGPGSQFPEQTVLIQVLGGVVQQHLDHFRRVTCRSSFRL